MIGTVESLDAQDRVGEAQFAGIYLLARCHDACDGAQPDLDPRGAGVHVGRQRLCEHGGIELERLAVGIEIGARKSRFQERRAELDGAAENLVHEAILGASEGQGIETGLGQEHRGIVAAAVGRGADQRHLLLRGRHHLKRRVDRRAQLSNTVHGTEITGKAWTMSPPQFA